MRPALPLLSENIHPTYTVKDGELVFTEELDVTAATIPSEHYGEVKDFFEHVSGAEHAAVVLAKR
jgi:hypothetical protein